VTRDDDDDDDDDDDNNNNNYYYYYYHHHHHHHHFWKLFSGLGYAGPLKNKPTLLGQAVGSCLETTHQ